MQDRESYREIAEKVIERKIQGKSYAEQISILINTYQKEQKVKNMQQFIIYYCTPYLQEAIRRRLDEICIKFIEDSSKKGNMSQAITTSIETINTFIKDPEFIDKQFGNQIKPQNKKVKKQLKDTLKTIIDDYSVLGMDEEYLSKVEKYTDGFKKFWREDALMYTSEGRRMAKFDTVEELYRFDRLRKKVQAPIKGGATELKNVNNLIEEEFQKLQEGKKGELTFTDILILAKREQQIQKEMQMMR